MVKNLALAWFWAIWPKLRPPFFFFFFPRLRLHQSLYFIVSYYYVKHQRKLMIQFWENLVTNGQTDRQSGRLWDRQMVIQNWQTNRQRDDSDLWLHRTLSDWRWASNRRFTIIPIYVEKKKTRSLDEEYMPYDVESLFSNIPKDQTILYIISFFYLTEIHST